jgi:RND family efflux transporter MFP subunit
MILGRDTFHRELVSNGTLEALQKAKLRFEISGELKTIKVENGEFVKKGRLLARLNDYTLRNELRKARISLEQAKVEFQDVLIGQGYDPQDTASVPDRFLRIARVKSGLAVAEANLEQARHKLNSTGLHAPFSGVVANIEKKEHDRIGSGEDFCTLIDNRRFHVKFSVLESELDQLGQDKEIMVRPLAGGSYRGYIDQINPVVDKNGLVTVRGVIQNPNGNLMEGMNVKVEVRNKLPNRLVIPKTAMVLRQNKEVVFTLQNDSLALWNYIQTGLENSNNYTVTDGLETVDTVITSGNINLAHESKVTVE